MMIFCDSGNGGKGVEIEGENGPLRNTGVIKGVGKRGGSAFLGR
jgi:hypothetical protein